MYIFPIVRKSPLVAGFSASGKRGASADALSQGVGVVRAKPVTARLYPLPAMGGYAALTAPTKGRFTYTSSARLYVYFPHARKSPLVAGFSASGKRGVSADALSQGVGAVRAKPVTARPCPPPAMGGYAALTAPTKGRFTYTTSAQLYVYFPHSPKKPAGCGLFCIRQAWRFSRCFVAGRRGG